MNYPDSSVSLSDKSLPKSGSQLIGTYQQVPLLLSMHKYLWPKELHADRIP